jgi:hypothetical protein
MSNIAHPDFDYDQLDGETWKFVQDARDQIRHLGKQTVESICEIGRLLTEVKARLPHGQWLPWLKAEFAWSEGTARRFMDSHRLVKSSNLEDLPRLLEMPPSAVADMAASSTPEPARQEIIERVGQGERITTEAVKETIARHKELPPRRYETRPPMARMLGIYRAMTPRERNQAARWILEQELKHTSLETKKGATLRQMLEALTFSQPDREQLRAFTKTLD